MTNLQKIEMLRHELSRLIDVVDATDVEIITSVLAETNASVETQWRDPVKSPPQNLNQVFVRFTPKMHFNHTPVYYTNGRMSIDRQWVLSDCSIYPNDGSVVSGWMPIPE